MSVVLSILVDNQVDQADHAGRQSLCAGDGLAMHLVGPHLNVLYDTGHDGMMLLHNARTMGVDLSSLDLAIVSHGHYDHTGGLRELARAWPKLHIYAHRDVFARRWANEPGKPMRNISCPHDMESLCKMGAVFHPVNHSQRLAEWLVLSGPIGGQATNPEAFVIRRGDDLIEDPFADEICVLVRGQAGWVVLTGCCHRGLRNTLRASKFLVHDEPIVALVGGLHLEQADADQLAEAGDLLEAAGSPELYPGHCTGSHAVAYLRERFPHKVHPLATGTRISF